MTDLKNPNDSLQDYFDDLLLGTSFESETDIVPPPIQVEDKIKSNSVPPAPIESVVVEKKTQVQEKIAPPQFADPVASQKEKLQKLLQSAQPKIQVATPVEQKVEAAPVVAIPVVAKPVVAPTVAAPTLAASIVTKPAVVAPTVKVEVAPTIAPVTQTVIPTITPAAIPIATAFKPDPEEIQEWDIGENPAVIVEPITHTEIVTATPEVEKTQQMSGLQWMPNGLPQWAQARFDVLLIKVSGLTLAVPLISLGQIQPITNELTHIFGQADWFIGIQQTAAGKIRVVNTAKFVMPERYDENFVKNAKYLVSINGVPWGLAVDSVNQPISLQPDAVKWRTDRSKRPWLAGTIKEHMCALLDIPMIGQILMESDKNVVKNHL